MRLPKKIRPKLDKIKDALKSWLPETRRGRILLYVVAGLGAAFFLSSLFVAIWSGYPSFCRSCHHIRPHYDSWASSKHAEEGVSCLECHFEPGVGAYVAGKVNGLVEVVKYFSGGYPTKLRSRVADASCLREGCHDIDELKAEPVEFGNIRFGHEKHLQVSRGAVGSTTLSPPRGAVGSTTLSPPRGVGLRCASCHSTSMHAEGETVSARGCFTCHFMPGRADETVEAREVREKLGKCDTCHELPGEVTTVTGTTFDHEKYAVSEAECSRCHAWVTQGDGAVLKERCHTCHNEGLGHLDEFAETESLHEIHVTEHQVACFECHAEIRHGLKGVVALAAWPRSFSPAGRHAAAENLYRGTGGAGVGNVPDPMFITDVQCAGCHASAREGIRAASGPSTEATRRGREGGYDASPTESCASCHEEGPSFAKASKGKYDKLAARWKVAFDGYVSALEAARGKAASLDRLAPRAKELLAEAARNIELVREGGAVHNVRYAASCLRHAQTGLAEILRPAGLGSAAAVMPTYEEGAEGCLEVCHLGVETVGTLAYADGDFPHHEHVMSSRVKCAQCHSFDEERHAETFEKTSDCSACHHEGETVVGDSACKSCHPLQDAIYFGKVAGDPRARPSKMAVAKVAETQEEVTCVSCHKGVSQGHSKGRLVQLCQECHGGQKARARILDEWQAGIREERTDLEGLIRRAKVLLKDRAGLSREQAVALRGALARSLKVADRVRRDGSFGAHNIEYVYALLSDAAGEIMEALAAAE